MKIDPSAGWRAIQARIDRTTDPVIRDRLRMVHDHVKTEALGQFDALMATMTDEPAFHFWIGATGLGGGPKGREAVANHYRQLYEEGRNRFQYDIERIVADEECVVTEGDFLQVYPGHVLRERGLDVDDPDATYAVKIRLAIFWPFAPDGKLIGEDSYADGEMFSSLDRVTKLVPDEIPPHQPMV